MLGMLCYLNMERYTPEQRFKIIKLFYQNQCSYVNTERNLRRINGRHHPVNQLTIRRIVNKFESEFSLLDTIVPVRKRNARTQVNINAVAASVRDNPNLSIPRRSQQLNLSQTTTWRILKNDLLTTIKSSSPKKFKKTSTKSSQTKAPHPPTAAMVNNAIQNLKERRGSSLKAIKKYISSTYKIDAEKLAPYIRKYLKTSVTSGALVQTKGKGASGSFKLSTTSSKTKKAPSVVKVDKKPVVEKPSKSKVKSAGKPIAVKKSPAKAVKAKKASAPAKKVSKPTPKSTVKVKKVAKVPIKWLKSPKPKTTKPKVVAKTTKKTASKKK